MRINFELNTENENPSMLQATAAYLNNLANINAGTALEPVHGSLEPEAIEYSPKGKAPVTEPQNDFKKESIAESIAAVKEQLAAEKEQLAAEKEQLAAEKEQLAAEKEESKKEEPEKPARRKAKPAPEVKTEPEQAKEPEQPKEPVKEPVKEPEQAKEPEQPKEPVKEPVKEPERAKEPVTYTMEEAKAVAMKALNKGRREVVKDAFGYVGASSFPTLAPENFADFIKYIEENL